MSRRARKFFPAPACAVPGKTSQLDRWIPTHFTDPGPGRYDPPCENKPESGPDSPFSIPVFPGKPRKTSRLGSHGKQLKIRPRLLKYARFRWQIRRFNRVGTGDLLATSRHPCGPWIDQKNAAKYVGLEVCLFTTWVWEGVGEKGGKQAGGI